MDAHETPAVSELLEYGIGRLHEVHETVEVPCKICGGAAQLFDVLDFGRVCSEAPYLDRPYAIPVCYRRCAECSFIFTNFFDEFPNEFWTRFVYNSDYYSIVDPEYQESRPRKNFHLIGAVLHNSRKWIGLDYGAGNGMLARLLDASGLPYDSYDPFGSTSMREELADKYNFCSAFEVAEHTPDPVGFLSDIVRLCTRDKLLVLIGTHVHDDPGPRVASLSRWNYAAPRNGHVSLYTRTALDVLASRVELKCHSMSDNLHFFARGYTSAEVTKLFGAARTRLRLQRFLPALFGGRRFLQ